MQKSSFLVGHVSFWQAQALACILVGAVSNGPSLGAEQGRGEGRRRKTEEFLLLEEFLPSFFLYFPPQF